ncbi:hypothetical protein R0K04_26965, partial [Pseudoalteromonas sp. SIMBA_153]
MPELSVRVIVHPPLHCSVGLPKPSKPIVAGKEPENEKVTLSTLLICRLFSSLKGGAPRVFSETT